jgi:hypothetical protein
MQESSAGPNHQSKQHCAWLTSSILHTQRLSAFKIENFSRADCQAQKGSPHIQGVEAWYFTFRLSVITTITSITSIRTSSLLATATISAWTNSYIRFKANRFSTRNWKALRSMRISQHNDQACPFRLRHDGLQDFAIFALGPSTCPVRLLRILLASRFSDLVHCQIWHGLIDVAYKCLSHRCGASKTGQKI